MKKLQNNFTTSEQSKRLLELGLPADSADCCVENTWDGLMIYVFRGCETYSTIDEDEHPNIQYPCWSVGRLREIFCICSSVNGTRDYPFCNDQVAWWITEFEFKKEFIDFSKLED